MNGIFGNYVTSPIRMGETIVSITDATHPDGQLCVGTIISQSYILTTQNCMDNYRVDDQSQMTKIQIVFLNENRSVIRYIDQISTSNSNLVLLHLSTLLDLLSLTSLTRPQFFSKELLQTNWKSSFLIIGIDLQIETKNLKMLNVLATSMNRQDPICRQQKRHLNNEECYIINQTDGCNSMFFVLDNFNLYLS